jgi:hypothetical protein
MKLSTSLNNYQEYLNTETNYDQLFNDFLSSDMVKELYEEKKPVMNFNQWKSQMKKRKNTKINQKRLNEWVEIRRGELNEKFNELARNQELNEIRIEKGEADRLRRQMEKMKEDYEAQIENMKALHENKVKYLEGTISNLRQSNFRNINTIKKLREQNEKLKEQKVETIIEEVKKAQKETIIEVEEPEPEPDPEPEPEKVIEEEDPYQALYDSDYSDEEDEPPLDNQEIQYIQAKEEVELVYYQPEKEKKSFDIKQLKDFISSNSSKWEMRFYEDFNESEITYSEILDSIKVQYYDEFGEPEKDGDKDTISREIGYELEKIDIVEPVKY